MKKLDIENSAGQWPTYCRQILDFVELEYYRPDVVVDDNDLSLVYDARETDLFFSNSTDHPAAIYWLGFGEKKGQLYTTVAPGETAKCRGAIGHFYAIKDVNNNQTLETIFVADENQTITIQ